MNTAFPPWSDSVPTIEELIDGADELAQAVLNAWGLNAITGHTADFTADFKALANIASAYRAAKQAADRALRAKAIAEKMSSQGSVDDIQLDLLIERSVADVNSARESLARTSKEYLEKNGCAFVETRAAQAGQWADASRLAKHPDFTQNRAGANRAGETAIPR